MTAVPHQIIRASAGSGKTYQLTLRFIRLLALGAAPDHIVALTFTRKAAGEFFSRILARLADAADDESLAQTLAAAIDRPGLASADFRRLLRAVIAGMHRLRLGTLDSFFAQILRCYPYEFGLSSDFSVPGAEMARIERQRVLARLFEPGEELSGAQREFFDAFKQATWGDEEFRLSRQLDEFIESRHSWFLGAPFADQWGGEKIIWPNGFPCDELSPQAMAEAVARIRPVVDAVALTDGQRERWDGLFAAFTEPGLRLFQDKRLRYFLDRFHGWPAAGGLQPVEMDFDRKKFLFPPEAWRAFRALFVHAIGQELRAASLRSAGVWRLLSHYEAAYHRISRTMGKLSFADVQALLAGATPEQRQTLGGASPLAQMALAFRLDGRFDHWLLDEFQDTSLLQWRIVQPLVDEVLQDDEGRRTYFHVGDSKQAIYAWREGESRLTDVILDRYGHAIDVLSLDVSHRSAPAVLDAVNRICGAAAIRSLFPEASDRWFKLWLPHRAAAKNSGLSGHAALIRPLPAHTDDEPAFEREMRTIAALLQRLQPLTRGLTCAVLVEKNDTVRAAARAIQQLSGLPTTSEARQRPAADNMPARALLDLLHASAHPGDTLSWQAVLMSPLRDVFQALKLSDTKVRTEVLADIHSGGFSHCLALWTGRLLTHLPDLDTFNVQRLERLIDLGSRYDDEGGTDIDEFLTFARGVEIRTEATPKAVQCMTIHASKGLEYDVVFMPALNDDSYKTLRNDWLMKRNEQLDPKWFLRVGQRRIAQCDAVLADALADMVGEQVYEALCTTYVAVTRAKRALYLIGDVPGGSSKSGGTEKRNTAVWFDEALADGSPAPLPAGQETLEMAWQTGDANWFWDIAASTPPLAVAKPPPGPFESLTALPRAPRKAASTSARWAVDAATLFHSRRHEARRLGSCVHEVFALLDESPDPERLERRFAECHPAPTEEMIEARRIVRRCLDDPDVRAALTVPSGATLWREKACDVMIDGQFLSATFDRVHLAGNRATIFDFKTDEPNDPSPFSDALARYRPQLELYRKILSHLAGLPPESIDLCIVNTSAPAVSALR